MLGMTQFAKYDHICGILSTSFRCVGRFFIYIFCALYELLYTYSYSVTKYYLLTHFLHLFASSVSLYLRNCLRRFNVSLFENFYLQYTRCVFPNASCNSSFAAMKNYEIRKYAERKTQKNRNANDNDNVTVVVVWRQQQNYNTKYT